MEAKVGGDPWGDKVVKEYLLTNVIGLDPHVSDIDLDRGPRQMHPRPYASYIEQHASIAIYIGKFLQKRVG
jgi:hypothetical protein